MPLTDAHIHRTHPMTVNRWLADGKGLRLLITPAGGKYWRLKYRYEGQQKTLALGVFPEVLVADARTRTEQARGLLAEGIDPAQVRRQEKTGSAQRVEKLGNERESPAESTRGNRVARAVFAAVLELISDPRAGKLSMEAVAERSGVHKTTLYRRWATFRQLVKAALAEVDISGPELADTGSLQGDLLHLAHQYADMFARPGFVAAIRLIAGNQDPELQHLIEEYWTDRASLFGALVERALKRGEPALHGRLAMANEVIVGPMLVRSLMRKQPIDEELITQLALVAHATLRGAGPRDWPLV